MKDFENRVKDVTIVSFSSGILGESFVSHGMKYLNEHPKSLHFLAGDRI